jgi:formylglycine-generating enzyme required for sulfatase activity
MMSNVWDWTADLFRVKSLSQKGKAKATAMRDYQLIKGDGYLCHASYCTCQRIAARTRNSPDSSANHWV